MMPLFNLLRYVTAEEKMVFKVGIGQPKLTGASLKRLTAIIGFKDTQMDMSTRWLCLMWRSTSSEVSFTKGAGAFCPANGNQLSKTSCTDNISMTKRQKCLLTLPNELELIGPAISSVLVDFSADISVSVMVESSTEMEYGSRNRCIINCRADITSRKWWTSVNFLALLLNSCAPMISKMRSSVFTSFHVFQVTSKKG